MLWVRDFVTSNNNVVFSFHGPFPSSPLFSLDHFDTSNPNIDDDVVISLDDSSSTLDTIFPNAP